MSQNVILVLGAGPNVGFHVAKYFGQKSFKTAAVSRNPTEELTKTVDLTIKADLEDPVGVKAIFDEVKAKLGVPNVVVYNGMSPFQSFSYLGAKK
jgi:NAD(P)-dependent dehydrogenase (short-subunit alcohol dehydrogenase family)